MTRRHIWLIAGLLLATSACAQVVLKADFEAEGQPGQPEGWVFRQARGECSGKWVDDEAASGKRSVCLSIPADETARAHWAYGRRVPIRPDTGYRLSVKMMVVEVQGEAYVICYENGGQDPEHWHDTQHVSGTDDWQEHAVEFRSRPDAEWLDVVCKLRHGTGYAWFDDIVIEETPVEEGRRIRVVPEDDGFALQAMWSPAQWCRDGVIHLVRGRLNPLSVFFWGSKGQVKSPAFVIEATEGLTLRGPVVKGRGPMPADLQVEPEAVRREGRVFRRWRFPIPEGPLLGSLREKPHWAEYHHVYADVASDCPARGELRWRLESAGKLGPEHTLSVVVPPDVPMRLSPPDHFRIYVQHTGALRHPDAAVRERLIEYLNTAGIVGGLAMAFYEPDRADVDGQYARLGFDLHTWRFDAYGGSVPDEHRLVDRDGERSKSRVCPQAQIERVQPWCDALTAYYRGKLASGLKRLIIDYEPPVFDVCFCPRCRAAFAKRSDLRADECATLPPKELQSKYAQHWGRFRAEQNGAIVKLHCDLIHEIDPEVAVGLCSWNGMQWTADRGGDIALFEPHAAFHCPMIYTQGTTYHSIVRETCERTQAPVLPFIELSDISQPRSLTPEQLRMNLLATGLSGGAGAFMWVGIECFDAGYMEAIARSVREVARLREEVPLRRGGADWLTVEPVPETTRNVVVEGRQITIGSPNSAPFIRSHLWGTRDKALVAFLNYDRANAYRMRVKLTEPGGGRYVVRDALTGTPLRSGAGEGWSAEALARGVELDVPPQGLAALAISAVK